MSQIKSKNYIDVHVHVHVHLHVHVIFTVIHFIYFIALTEYGWTRKNGKLEIIWEVSENIAK